MTLVLQKQINLKQLEPAILEPEPNTNLV